MSNIGSTVKIRKNRVGWDVWHLCIDRWKCAYKLEEKNLTCAYCEIKIPLFVLIGINLKSYLYDNDYVILRTFHSSEVIEKFSMTLEMQNLVV